MNTSTKYVAACIGYMHIKHRKMWMGNSVHSHFKVRNFHNYLTVICRLPHGVLSRGTKAQKIKDFKRGGGEIGSNI